jgi:glycerate kinase
MARAWGWRPCDATGREIPDGGGSLAHLETLVAGRHPAARLTALVDVLNPLTGPSGAREYAAQKGATPEQVELLARGLSRLAEFARAEGREDLIFQAGAGAAGGLGFGITFFGGGSLVPGAAWVLDRIGFSAALKGADLVICGEGAFDATSLKGKLTGSVISRAREAGVPAALMAPRAQAVPADVLLETGGGRWTPDDIAHRAAVLVRRALRT